MNDITGIDSNIFVYAADKTSGRYIEASRIISDAALGKVRAVIVPQNLTEYYATVTNSKKVPIPMTNKTAIEQMEKLLRSSLKLVYPNNRTTKLFIELLGLVGVKAQRVYDIFLAATLLSNGIRTLITENKEDFAGIKDLKTIDLSEW